MPEGKYIGHKEDAAITDPTADATTVALLKGLLTKMGVMAGASPVVTPATGTGAIAATYAPGAAFWLHGVTLKFSATPTTSQDFTVTLDAADGDAYDTLLLSHDLAATGTSRLVWTPDDGPLLCEEGDAIDVAYPNSDGNTYGVRIIARLA